MKKILTVLVIGLLLTGCSLNKTKKEEQTPEKNEAQQEVTQTNGNSFLFAIEDIFEFTGKGTYAYGQVIRGTVKAGDKIQLLGLKDEVLETEVVAIENKDKKTLSSASKDDEVYISLKGIERTDIERGQVIAAPNTIKTHTKFTAKITMLKTEDGGRHTPIFTNYRPQFYFRKTDVTGVLKLPEDIEMLLPGESATVSVEIIHPVAFELGDEFKIREGGRVVATGKVETLD